MPTQLSNALDLCEQTLEPGMFTCFLQRLVLGFQAAIHTIMMLRHLHPSWQHLPLAATAV